MGSTLVALPLAGLFLGGFRAPALWTPAAALLWLAVLDERASVDARALRAWAPWLGWLAASALFCAQPLKSLPALTRWSSVALYFALIRAVWGAAQRRQWLYGLWTAAPVLGLAGLATGARALLQVGQGTAMTGFLPPYYNYTVYVEAAALASAVAWLARRRAEAGSRRAAIGALCALLAALILLSRSRGGILAATAGAAVAAARRGGWRGLARPGAGLLAIGALVTALAVARGHPADYLLKLDAAASFKRPQIWRAAVAVAKDHPFFGEGPGNFEAGFLRHNFRSGYGATDYQFSTPYAHSEIFHALAETGFLGLVLLLAAFARSLRLPEAGRADDVQEAALAAAAAMGAMCVFDNMLQIPGLALLLFSAIAAASDVGKVENSLSPWPRRALAAAGLLLTLGAWMPGWLAAGQRSRAADEYDDRKRVSLLRDAAAIYPQDADVRESLARAYLLLSPPRPDLARAELERAAALSPTNAVFLLDLAELLEAQGRLDGAAALADKAVALEPHCLEGRLMLAAAAARRGDKAAARARLEEVSRLRAELERPLREYGGGFDARVCAFDRRRFEAVRKMVESAR